MKNIFSIIILLFTTSIFAQNTFKATIISEKTKKNLVGATASINELNTTETSNKKGEIMVGDHPNEMILNKNGDVLFVANSLDNSVSIIDLLQRSPEGKSQKVIEVLNAALYPNAPNGSTTNGFVAGS